MVHNKEKTRLNLASKLDLAMSVCKERENSTSMGIEN